MQLGLQERGADQQVLVGRPVRKRWDRDISVEIVQYFAAVFVQAVKSRRGGETDRLKVLEEQADLGRGRAAGSAHRVIDADDRADVVNSAWTRFGNQGVIAENDPAEQEKSVKWNSLLCNLIVFHTAIDMMEVIRQLVAEGWWQVTAEDLAQLSPYLTSHILRFGAYATDELHIPPDVFDSALDEVDFGGEQPAAA